MRARFFLPLFVLFGCGAASEDDPEPSTGSGGADGSGGTADQSGGQAGDSGGSSGGVGSGGAEVGSGGGAGETTVLPYVRRLAAAGGTTCAIEVGGSVVCWAGDDESAPLTGEFVELSMQWGANRPLICGVRTDSTIECDSDGFPTDSGFEHVTVLTVDAGCASKSDGALVCWGYDGYVHPESGDFDALTSSRLVACGLKLGEAAVCWPPESTLAHPTSDRADMSDTIDWCQIVDGRVDCRGADPFQGALTDAAQVAVSPEVVCALGSDGRRLCAGPDASLVNLPAESARFVEIAVGYTHGCGVEMGTGLVRCWGTSVGAGADAPATVPRDIRVF